MTRRYSASRPLVGMMESLLNSQEKTSTKAAKIVDFIESTVEYEKAREREAADKLVEQIVISADKRVEQIVISSAKHIEYLEAQAAKVLIAEKLRHKAAMGKLNLRTWIGILLFALR